MKKFSVTIELKSIRGLPEMRSEVHFDTEDEMYDFIIRNRRLYEESHRWVNFYTKENVV
jgi:hypothetical protein